MKFYYKSSCTTCRKARKYLKDHEASFQERDMSKDPLSKKEIETLIGNRDITPFLNTRNALYREKKFKDHPPSAKKAIELMATEPNLIKRPLLIKNKKILFGFSEDSYQDLLSSRSS
ncbi:MAG: Spx/MgsR family RNA polymerase-binding regulatory protein [Bdellovibrionales bacterium]|nr:Spx/MgsR family RNA polymerase-binding regulatory protein [Bdellovibrionales bacterium]